MPLVQKIKESLKACIKGVKESDRSDKYDVFEKVMTNMLVGGVAGTSKEEDLPDGTDMPRSSCDGTRKSLFIGSVN